MAITEKRSLLKFAPEYKRNCFDTWYRNGQPSAEELYDILPDYGDKAPVGTLKTWIQRDFVPKALELTERLQRERDDTLVAEKIEMFNRHSSEAKELQNMAVKYLEEHGLDRAADAIRLYQIAVDVERESRGVSQLIESMIEMSEEDIYDFLQQLVSGEAPILDVEHSDGETQD